MLGAIEISGARYTRVHVPVQLVRRHKWVVVSHKKDIPGVRRQQLKSVANRSLSGNLLVVSETDCVDDNELWEILKEMGITDHLTCLLRNL